MKLRIIAQFAPSYTPASIATDSSSVTKPAIFTIDIFRVDITIIHRSILIQALLEVVPVLC
jgi:hypothetical protein